MKKLYFALAGTILLVSLCVVPTVFLVVQALNRAADLATQTVAAGITLAGVMYAGMAQVPIALAEGDSAQRLELLTDLHIYLTTNDIDSGCCELYELLLPGLEAAATDEDAEVRHLSDEVMCILLDNCKQAQSTESTGQASEFLD